ncbi:MAG: L,D-transpeptidase, partial [Pseudolabrys sp.]
MRINRLIALMTAGTVAVLVLGEAARADLLIQIDKSIQRMTVTVDGKQLYDWPVSSGGRGYDTPSGSFKPFRMEIDHRSDEWDDAPMPYSIFFTKIGHAIHGTYEQRNLGRAVSHGCVRLSVKNAATLWELVKRQKMANTTVVLGGAIPGA